MGVLISIGTWALANAGTIATVATTAASMYSQNETEKQAAADRQAEQDRYNKELHEDAMRKYGELDKVESDAIKQSHAESLQSKREFLTTRSNIELQSAVTGTYGNSVNIAIQDLKTGLGGRMAEITERRDSQLDEITRTADAIASGVRTGADTTKIKQPSFYSAFSTGLSTYSTVRGFGEKVDKTTKDASRRA